MHAFIRLCYVVLVIIVNSSSSFDFLLPQFKVEVVVSASVLSLTHL